MKTNKNIKLDEISKRSPFKVPENYFEDFSKKMEEHVATYAPARKVSFMMKVRPYLYMAASFVVILAVTLAVLNKNEGEQSLVASNKSEKVITQTSTTSTTTDSLQPKESAITSSSDTDKSEVYFDEEDEDEMIDEMLASDYDI